MKTSWTHIPYEKDDQAFPANAYTVKGYRGIAWYVLGWEIETSMPLYDEEPEDERTGSIVCVMVGDDRRYVFGPDEITPLGELEYCSVCGQIGCCHDGKDRSGVIMPQIGMAGYEE